MIEKHEEKLLSVYNLHVTFPSATASKQKAVPHI
jgi:hypothetical protein